MSEQVQIERDGAVVSVRMARPEKKNALTVAMYDAMERALVDAAEDPSVRAIVVTGAGGVFTSGNDLRDFAAAPPVSDDSAVFRFLHTISTCPVPIVAGVSGLAIGIGTTMLLHCDLVVADPATRFSLPFINLGLVPEAASSLILPRMLGHLRASELLLLGEMFDAETAERLGLINRISGAGNAESDAVALAHALARKAPQALRRTKALLKRDSAAVATRMQDEARDFAAQLRGPEFREALAAFTEKRAADFS